MIHDLYPLLKTVINKLNQSQVAKQKGPKTLLLSPHHLTDLIGCSSGAAMLGQFKHGPVALAAGRTVEAVGPVIMNPLVVAEVSG